MVILITGSSGYVGKYLVNKFEKTNTIIKYDLPQDITNYQELEQIFKENKIEVVIHTAAQKYVDKAEVNPTEALETNIIGTFNVFKLCTNYQVKTCIYFSTDKAANPLNIYGITKQTGESLMNYFARQFATKFVALRPCNIYGSTGSVVPIFEKLLQENKPLKITDPKMTRYFMELDQVYEMVCVALNLAESGDILLYNITEATPIIDIAKDLCNKYNKEFKYEISGNRGNEKLHEEYSLENCISLTKNVYKLKK